MKDLSIEKLQTAKANIEKALNEKGVQSNSPKPYLTRNSGAFESKEAYEKWLAEKNEKDRAAEREQIQRMARHRASAVTGLGTVDAASVTSNETGRVIKNGYNLATQGYLIGSYNGKIYIQSTKTNFAQLMELTKLEPVKKTITYTNFAGKKFETTGMENPPCTKADMDAIANGNAKWDSVIRAFCVKNVQSYDTDTPTKFDLNSVKTLF